MATVRQCIMMILSSKIQPKRKILSIYVLSILDVFRISLTHTHARSHALYLSFSNTKSTFGYTWLPIFTPASYLFASAQLSKMSSFYQLHISFYVCKTFCTERKSNKTMLFDGVFKFFWLNADTHTTLHSTTNPLN